MAEKLSDLERWLQQMQGEGARESSGQFTLDAGNRLERYGKMLSLNPSLAWLQLTQRAHQQQARSIELRLTRDCVEWVARGLKSDTGWFERLSQVSGDDTTLLLLHATNPRALEFSWRCRQSSWDWKWPGPQVHKSGPPQPESEGDLSVRLSAPLTPVLRRDLVSEFTARTHFAPIRMVIDGRPHPSRLDLTSAPSRAFGVAVDLIRSGSQPEVDYFAVVPPALHQPRMILVNSAMAPVQSRGSGEKLAPHQVACYHLHHPDLAHQIEHKRESNIDIGRFGLRGSARFLAPERRWVSLRTL